MSLLLFCIPFGHTKFCCWKQTLVNITHKDHVPQTFVMMSLPQLSEWVHSQQCPYFIPKPPCPITHSQDNPPLWCRSPMLTARHTSSSPVQRVNLPLSSSIPRLVRFPCPRHSPSFRLSVTSALHRYLWLHERSLRFPGCAHWSALTPHDEVRETNGCGLVTCTFRESRVQGLWHNGCRDLG